MQPKRADARQNRQHLIHVARGMTEDGKVPTFNALAREAGVGVGTVYRHFDDEQALATAMVADRLEAFRELVLEAEQTVDPWRALERLFEGSIALVMDEPVVAQVFASTPDVALAVQASADGIVKRARKAKVLRADFTTGDVRRLVCGIERAARTGDQPHEAAQRYLGIVLDGLRPPPGGHPRRRRST